MIRSPYGFRLLNILLKAIIHWNNGIKILKKTYFHNNCMPKLAAFMMAQLNIFLDIQGLKLSSMHPFQESYSRIFSTKTRE